MITADDLNEIPYLEMEIEDIDRKIKGLSNLYGRIHSALKAECGAALTELIQLYQIRRDRCATQLELVTGFMNSIEDDLLRKAFFMHFRDGMTWPQVSTQLDEFGWYSDENLRKMCQRYLKKQQARDRMRIE